MRARWRAAALLLSLGVAAMPALGDGPHVVFRGAAGAWDVTLFAQPAPLAGGATSFELLLSDRASGAPAGVAAAHATLTPQTTGAALPVAFAPGGNLVLPGALASPVINLPGPGTYRLALDVHPVGGQPVHLDGTLGVAANHTRALAVGMGVLLPLVVAGLFLLNQAGKAPARF